METIWLKPGRRAPMERRPDARLVVDEGMVGNHAGAREVTLITEESWDRVAKELRVRPDPSLRRANLMVRGVDLQESTGRRLRVGECLLEIGGETRPCARMDEGYPGLQAALDPEWRAGAWGRVVEGGTITAGDPVAWE